MQQSKNLKLVVLVLFISDVLNSNSIFYALQAQTWLQHTK